MSHAGSTSSAMQSIGVVKVIRKKSSYVTTKNELERMYEREKLLLKDFEKNDKRFSKAEKQIDRLKVDLDRIVCENCDMETNITNLKNQITVSDENVQNITKHKNDLTAENIKLREELRIYKEGYLRFVRIHSQVHADVTNIVSSDMPHSEHCLICLANNDLVKVNTGKDLLKLECSHGGCANMMCCKECFETYDRGAKVCMFCRKPGSYMRPCKEIIDLS
jgi:hypothetical protein